MGDIRVVDADTDATATFATFQNHPIAFELLGDPPLSRVMVYIDDCEMKAAHDEDDEVDCYQPPEPITIEREDGTSITLKDFVTRVHEYLNSNKEEILEAKDEVYSLPADIGKGTKVIEISTEVPTGQNIPEGTEFFFDGAAEHIVEDQVHVYVSVFAVGDLGQSYERFWSIKQGEQGVHAAQRERIFKEKGLVGVPTSE